MDKIQRNARNGYTYTERMEWRGYIESVEMHRINRYRWNAWNQIMDRNKQNEQKGIECKEIDDKRVEVHINKKLYNGQNRYKHIKWI